MIDWTVHETCVECSQEGLGPLNRENCIQYAFHFGYYTREQIEALWPEDNNSRTFFRNYVRLKHEEETFELCKCGNSTNFIHPWFGVMGGFGPAGACTCDGALR